MIRRTLIAAVLFVSATAHAQYTENFQSYGAHSNPPGWVDTSVGVSKPEAKGLFKTWPDPLVPANIVYGEQHSTPEPKPAAGDKTARVGTFSTYATKTFGGSSFEYRGRFLRTSSDTRVGVTFFSSYPEVDRYYLAGLWHQANGALTMQLFAYGAGTLIGTVDSGVTPEVNRWYRFAIRAEDAGGATHIRARYWRDGEAEPATWSIDANDASASRLTTGRIGMWSAVKGDAYIDELNVQTTSVQTITFF